MSTEGVRRFELKDRGNAAAQQAERARASAAAAAANADSSRAQAYRCVTTALSSTHGELHTDTCILLSGVEPFHAWCSILQHLCAD